MPDPLVSKVTDDDGTERYVAAGGPSDTDGSSSAEAVSPTSSSDTAEPADPNDPDADQPAHLVTEEAPDAAADAPVGDGADPQRRKRRS